MRQLVAGDALANQTHLFCRLGEKGVGLPVGVRPWHALGLVSAKALVRVHDTTEIRSDTVRSCAAQRLQLRKVRVRGLGLEGD